MTARNHRASIHINMLVLESLMPNAFGLNNSRDLCKKLEWEIEHLRNCPPGPGSPVSYLAFNCAVTAWHIADWVWHDLSDQQKASLNCGVYDLNLSYHVDFERLIRRKSEDLRLCYVIAQRVKHHTLRPRVDDPTVSVSVSVVPASMIWKGIGGYDAIDDHVIERAKIVIGGKTRPALDVFEGARAFWLEFLKEVDG